MTEQLQKSCPEIPFWGASYPDAQCVDGVLQDLDYCDENGNLYEKGEYIACPFCQAEEFIEQDYFGKVDEFLSELTGGNSDAKYDIHIKEAERKACEWYLNWIKKMEEKYG